MRWSPTVVVWLFLLAVAVCHQCAVVAQAPGTELYAFPNASNSTASNYGVEGIAVDSVGNIYVAAGGTGGVVVLSSAGALLHTFPNTSNPGASNYQFDGVEGVAVDSVGNIYVADGQTIDNGGIGRVVVLSSTGALLHAFPNASNPVASNYQFDGVAGVAVDSAGNIYVADSKTSDNGGIGRVVVLAGVNGTSSPAPVLSSTASSSFSLSSSLRYSSSVSLSTSSLPYSSSVSSSSSSTSLTYSSTTATATASFFTSSSSMVRSSGQQNIPSSLSFTAVGGGSGETGSTPSLSSTRSPQANAVGPAAMSTTSTYFVVMVVTIGVVSLVM